VFLTSGPQRRLNQWENVSFSAYLHADTKSQAFQDVLVQLFTGTLVAAKPDKANTRTMGLMAEAFLFSVLGLGPYKDADRLLNGPTNDAFIDPWVAYLRSLGVTFQLDAAVTGLSVTDKKISGAQVTGASGTTAVDADYYVLAVPVERAVPVLNDQILTVDPSLRSLRELVTDWMNGVMLYLREPINLAKGHVVYGGAPWALTSISQAQFWKDKFSTTYGHGDVNDCLSLDVSAWDVPGILYGKAARDCTPDEIFKEILAQMRKAVPSGATVIADANIHSYFIDPAIIGPGTAQVTSDEPLLINHPGSWKYRPEATTALPNLFLASDYVKSNINLASMEGANEAGRKAANGILAASGAGGTPAPVAGLYQPPELKAIYAADDARYAHGLPNALDIYDPARP
jgi:uncharacterized protein with NAD-binding domain and iron-sulfur cluster